MEPSLDPSQLVYESLTEPHGDDYVGRSVVYSPEGEMVFESEVNVEGETGFRMVFDAGDMGKDDVEDELEGFDVAGVNSSERVSPEMDYLGIGCPEGAPTEEAWSYVLEDGIEFNVALEDVGSSRRSKLVVDGVYERKEDLEEAVARYANELSDFDIRPFTGYMEEDAGVNPENKRKWELKTWSELIGESFREAIQAIPLEDQS